MCPARCLTSLLLRSDAFPNQIPLEVLCWATLPDWAMASPASAI